MKESKNVKESLRHLAEISACPMEEQEKLLMRVLKNNKDTFFGKKYGFSEIRSVKEFQETLPLTDFEDYEELIDREIAGERGLFTADPPYFFCISSGSLGTPKYFPLVKEDAVLQRVYWDWLICSIIRRDFSQYTEEDLFGKIFLMSDFFRTSMPDGSMNGVRSAVSAMYRKNEGSFPFELYYAPPEVLFPDELVDMQYVKFRFALAERNITALHANFAHKAVSMMRYLESHWEQILSDMETGEVSPEFHLNEKWTAYLKEKLPPDPKRAHELRAFSGSDLRDGMIRKIWPNAKYLRLVYGMQFHPFSDQMDVYSGGLPVYPFVYAATEAVFGVAQGVGKMDAYVLIPDLCFFEFLPELDENSPALTLAEVEEGKRYEIVITTVSGLYRYRLGDVIEVVGFENKTPVISINYRKSQTLNLAGENMNAIQFENAIELLLGDEDFLTEGYCVGGNTEKTPPCYRIFIEQKKPLPKDASALMDAALSKSCPGYKEARQNGRMGMCELVTLSAGAFREYESFLSGGGKNRSEQTKPLKILKTEEQRKFFEGKGIV